MSMKPYKTLLRAASDEFVVNKSRFIGHGCPCETEEAALAFLAEIRARHKDATHNCYAYIVGANMGIMRYSDDGEPGGTAGMPIIEVMKARGVTNCAVVVTRYFGGILLGAGGLVRAYSQGAAATLNACGVGVMHPTARYLLEVPYPMLGRLEFFLKTEPVIVEEKQFADAVILTLVVRTSDEEAFAARLTNMSEGRLEPLRCEEFYRPWPEEGQ
ncbi:MAG TPA: YigZ family protein [Candidatus Faecivicinus avistercoris]|nr:YigZ family protein [Candidatus Faecivicinus avistercoris]